MCGPGWAAPSRLRDGVEMRSAHEHQRWHDTLHAHKSTARHTTATSVPLPGRRLLFFGQRLISTHVELYVRARALRAGAERLPSGPFAGSVCCARVAPLGGRKRQVQCEPGGPNLGVQSHTSALQFLLNTRELPKKKLHACNCNCGEPPL